MTINFLDVPCSDCGAKQGHPCKRAMYPHSARKAERDRRRVEVSAAREDHFERMAEYDLDHPEED